MNAEEFVDAIRQVVRKEAIGETIFIVKRPPGRKPVRELVEQAEWYRSLDARQQALLERVIADAVDSAIFGIFCVIDGVRAVESEEIKGRFELRYVKNGVTLLNPPEGAMLHDLYNAI